MKTDTESLWKALCELLEVDPKTTCRLEVLRLLPNGSLSVAISQVHAAEPETAFTSREAYLEHVRKRGN